MLYAVLFGVLRVDRRLAHLTAPDMLDVKDQGIALQAEAFRDKDLLPVYGSSEFRNDTRFSGRRFFADYPTGFRLFIIGKAGSKTLITAERIGALGDAVRGRKVVIILSPTWFLTEKETAASYAGNFSAAQAGKLIFDSPLSHSLKSRLAREMLKYPKTLSPHPLLRLELDRLARKDRGIETRLLSSAGRAAAYFVALWDRMETPFALLPEVLQSPGGLAETGPHAKTTPPWARLTKRAARHSSPELWEEEQDTGAPKLERKLRGKDKLPFVAEISRSDEWQHLSLLMETLKQLGARPLFISLPLNADAFEIAGVKPADLDYYYARLRDEVRDYGFPVVTFEDEQNDPWFFHDSVGHPSSMGWMILNHTINRFYHGKLPTSLD